MTIRKPLVTVGGRNSELPAGDTLALFGDLATPDQFADAGGDIAEIEATRALRATLRPMGDNGEDYCISRHAIGLQLSHVATTTFVANSEIVTLMNLTTYPIALRKLGISAGTSALSGARVGLARICALEMFACFSLYSSAFVYNPPIGNNVNLGTNSSSIKLQQATPGLLIGSAQSGSTPNGLPGFTAVVSGGRSIGETTGGAPSAVGTNIKPCWIFDSYGEEPYWIMPNRGLYVNSTFPAAGTSQTINYAVNILWDEWQLKPPR